MGLYLLAHKSDVEFVELVSKENYGDRFWGQEWCTSVKAYGLVYNNQLIVLLEDLMVTCEESLKTSTAVRLISAVPPR